MKDAKQTAIKKTAIKTATKIRAKISSAIGAFDLYCRLSKLRFLSLALALAGAYALTACQHTPKLKQASAVANNTELARIRVQIAAQYLASGQLDDAKKQLDMAMAADARFAPSYDMMALVLQAEGSAANLAKAQSYFMQAIALDDDFVQAHNNYAVYLARTGRWQDAVPHFERAATSLGYTDRLSSLMNLGIALHKIGEHERAIDAFERLLGAQFHLLAAEYLLALYLDTDKLPQAGALLQTVMLTDVRHWSAGLSAVARRAIEVLDKAGQVSAGQKVLWLNQLDQSVKQASPNQMASPISQIAQ